MGFKRAILNRLGISDNRVLLSKMDENNENGLDDGNRKHTDFSIARILSDDTPRILPNERMYQINDLMWNNNFLPRSPVHHGFSAFTPTTISAKYEIMNLSFCMYDHRLPLNTHMNQMPIPQSYEVNRNKRNTPIYQSTNSYGLNLSLSDKGSSNKVFNIDRIKVEPDACNNSTCSVCNKVFENSLALEAHEKTHKSPRYKCEECGKGFSQLRNYKYHVSVHKGTKEFAAKCPECDKLFNDKGYLSSHLKIHRNKKEYSCPHCPKSFNQRVAFNMHVRIHSGIKPHKCFECGKCFSRKMLLKQHLRTHSGEKPYQCSICLKTFADRSNMTLHQRLHSGIKPFACNICPKAFTKKHHLKTHLNYHIGCKPYTCPHPNCGKSFTQSSNMRTHSRKCEFRPMD